MVRKFDSTAIAGQTVILRDGSSVEVIDVTEFKGREPYFLVKRSLAFSTPWFVDSQGRWVDSRVVTRGFNDEMTAMVSCPPMPGMAHAQSLLDVVGFAPVKYTFYAVLCDQPMPAGIAGTLYVTQIDAAREEGAGTEVIAVELEY